MLKLYLRFGFIAPPPLKVYYFQLFSKSNCLVKKKTLTTLRAILIYDPGYLTQCHFKTLILYFNWECGIYS